MKIFILILFVLPSNYAQAVDSCEFTYSISSSTLADNDIEDNSPIVNLDLKWFESQEDAKEELQSPTHVIGSLGLIKGSTAFGILIKLATGITGPYWVNLSQTKDTEIINEKIIIKYLSDEKMATKLIKTIEQKAGVVFLYPSTSEEDNINFLIGLSLNDIHFKIIKQIVIPLLKDR